MRLLRNINRWLLNNYPEWWLTQLPLFLCGVLTALLCEAFLLRFVPLTASDSLLFVVPLVLFFAPLCFWLRFQYRHFQPHVNRLELYKIFLLNVAAVLLFSAAVVYPYFGMKKRIQTVNTTRDIEKDFAILKLSQIDKDQVAYAKGIADTMKGNAYLQETAGVSFYRYEVYLASYVFDTLTAAAFFHQYKELKPDELDVRARDIYRIYGLKADSYAYSATEEPFSSFAKTADQLKAKATSKSDFAVVTVFVFVFSLLISIPFISCLLRQNFFLFLIFVPALVIYTALGWLTAIIVPGLFDIFSDSSIVPLLSLSLLEYFLLLSFAMFRKTKVQKINSFILLALFGCGFVFLALLPVGFSDKVLKSTKGLTFAFSTFAAALVLFYFYLDQLHSFSFLPKKS